MMKKFITDSGKNQKTWAESLGISDVYLSLLLSRHRRPSLVLAVKIEKATGGAVTCASWIDGGDDEFKTAK